ncbi:MAG: ABC transporter permease [Lachnospiraceae bacterium]|nr:ABC transporter permease [Lachnospiraceae bacterium]MBR0106063.1 ABC transporter permease [Lachnospiraceae bacterium]MBR0401646.1 ABC transporter permease [Lachnospiraceae bacterium]
MRKYILTRLIQLIPVLFGLTIIVYGLMYLAPGDPAAKRLQAQGVSVNEEVLEAAREEMGLNRPFIVQYGSWVGGVFHGDLGDSFRDDMPVAGKIATAMKNTVILAVSSLILALAVSVPLGIWTAVHENGPGDVILRVLSFIGNSLPNFLISVLLMFVFCLRLRLLPVIARGTFTGLLLPTLALAIPIMSRLTRQIRAEVLEELGKPYVAGLMARGAKDRTVLYRNVLRGAMSPIITIVGLSVGTLLGGSVVIETIFSWPGIGKLAMDSILARDYPVIQGFVLVIAVIYVLINLATDLSYRALDPRLAGK